MDKEKFDLIMFNFPKLTEMEVRFNSVKTDKTLLRIARERGFYDGDTKYNKMFSKIFFSGGKIELNKSLNKDFLNNAFRYFKAFAGSFEPKHEEKEAICALILSEIAE